MTTVIEVYHYAVSPTRDDTNPIFHCTMTVAESDFTMTSADYFANSGSYIGQQVNITIATATFKVWPIDGVSPPVFKTPQQCHFFYDSSPNSTDPSIPLYNNNHSLYLKLTFGTDLVSGDVSELSKYYDISKLGNDPGSCPSSMGTIEINANSSIVVRFIYNSNGTLTTHFDSQGVYKMEPSPYPVVTSYQINQVIEPTMSNCFNQGTLLKGPNGIVAVENLKIGDLVSTYLQGDRKITRILRGVAVNKDSTKAQNTMCVMNGLYLTGGHSLMVDELSAEETEKQDAMGFSQKVDDKHLLLAMVSPLFEAAPPGTYQHYHFLLENDGDKTARYGVWANGVLCETPSQEYIESLGQ